MDWPLYTALVLCALLGTSWLVWPAIIWVIGIGRVRSSVGKTEIDLPTVTVVLAAHNEQGVILDKIRNTFSLEYPTDLLDMVIVSDGSNDNTNTLLSTVTEPRVTTVISESQSGKSLSLNKARDLARGEVVVFTDANSMLDKNALRYIVSGFSRKEVGCVSGELRYQKDDSDCADAGSLYWRYDVAIKKCEGRLGCLIGGVGPIFALRRELWRSLAPLEVPDLALGLVALERGMAAIYVPEAFTSERVAESVKHERRRYRRIISRGIPTAMHAAGRLLLRGRMFAFFSLMWHKLIRYFSGPLAFSIVVLAAISYRSLAGQLICLSALTGLLMAALGSTGPLARIRLFRLCSFALNILVSGTLGVWDWASGRTSATWSNPGRTVSAPVCGHPGQGTSNEHGV